MTEFTEMIPPQSEDMERCVLGAMMHRDEVALLGLELLTDEDFYQERHKLIFNAIRCVADTQEFEPSDIALIAHSLEMDGELELVGGRLYLSTIKSKVPLYTENAVQHYAGIVRAKALQRKLIAMGDRLMRESQQPNSNPSSIVTELYASLDQLTADKASSNLKTIEEAARMMTDGLADTIINGEQPGVCAPLQALRDCLYPARPKQLVFMAGRPGMGKTGMALTWALDAAKRGKRVLFVSLEIDFEELAERVLLQVTNLNSARVKSFSQFTNDPDEVITPLRNALPILGKYDMEICCPSGESCTPREISFLARMKKMRTGLDIIFVDYLGLLAPNEHRNKEYEEVTAISKQMKAVARQVDVPIICLHQLSREVESRNPRIPKLADFRSSGQIEQDAHAAILLYRPGYYHAQDGNWKENETASKHLGTTIASGDDTTTLIQIAKQRRGPTGHCFAQFDPQSTWFYDR